MNKKRKISSKEISLKKCFTEMLKLPEDIVCHAPVVTLLGSGQMRIENYRNLLEYQTDRIAVRVHSCKLIITGKQLEIVCYTNDEMYICGEIHCVSYER